MARTRLSPPSAATKGVTYLSLDKLLLDSNNPRFGVPVDRKSSQADILDRIVEKFGVDDILSSIAVNGYFAAEPLVCQRMRNSSSAIVIEGNRRLTACLILSGDPRAAHQRIRTEQYQAIWRKHGRKDIASIPVILFDEGDNSKELLSYLGVRHIASNMPWDSYAKAAWVARVVEENNFNITDVAIMIGDQHKTIQRLLEGYYFVQQLVATGKFRPEDSVRRGRGSVSEYPFSWLYTILGYRAARDFLGLSDNAATKNPIKTKSLSKAATLTTLMYGDKSRGRNSAIDDSRSLGQLASALADPEKVALLEAGKLLTEVERLTQPVEQFLAQALSQIRELQSTALTRLAEQSIESRVAVSMLDVAKKNRRAAGEIEKKLIEVSEEYADED